MKTHLSTRILAILGAVLTLSSATAELPTIHEGDGIGSFAMARGDVFELRISDDGLVTVNPISKNGGLSAYLRVRFKFSIRQALPNGKLRPLKVDLASLKSETPATSELSDVTIAGIAGDDVGFQMTVGVKRDVLTLSGRITEPGKDTRFPLSFHYDVTLGHFRGRLLQRLDGDIKEFEKIVGEDGFELQHLDGKKVKRQLTDIYELNTEETLNGPGSRKVEVQASIIDKNKRMLVFEAEGSSVLRVTKKKAGPFYEGYIVGWTPGASKDQKEGSKLVFEIEEK